jgi:hypothetical protein
MATKGSMHHEQAKRESAGIAREKAKQQPHASKVTVHPDTHSKPQTHRADAARPGHTEFVAVKHPNPKEGWKGKFVPKTSKSAAAAKQFLQQQNVPADPSQYTGG